jgi:hypothetical protein
MRLPWSAAPWAGLVCLCAVFLVRCGSTQTEVPVGADSGLDAGSLDPPDARAVVLDAPPATTACDDATVCLSGTATPGVFLNQPNELLATLYEGFPGSAAFGASATNSPSLIASQKVALDTTWAFDGLDAGTHYFVELDPGYLTASMTKAEETGIATVTGPFVVPSEGGLVLSAKPVEIAVFEQGLVGGSMQFDTVFARIDEPEAGSSSVSVEVGDASMPLTYSTTMLGYVLQLASPPRAQALYTVLTAPVADASSPVSWTLASNPPATGGVVVMPVPNAQVQAGQDLQIIWSPGAEDDYISVTLFAEDDAGNFALKYSASPVFLDTTIVAVPRADIAAGTYLLNVGFVRANCPPTRDGCVHSSRVVSEQLTAQ